MITSVPSLHTTGPQDQGWPQLPHFGHQVPVRLLPSTLTQPRWEGTIFFSLMRLSRRVPFSYLQLFLKPSSPLRNIRTPAPRLVASAPLFRCRRPRPSALEPCGRCPPTSPEGRAGGGGVSSILGVDWPGRGEGRGFSLGLGARDLPTGHSSRLRLWFRLSLRDSGDLHPGACLTSGAHRTPKPGGSRAPFRVSSAPPARPVGWPAVPYPSPPGQAPARRSQARLSLLAVRPLLEAVVSSLYAEDGDSCFARAGGQI